ncbi:MAG: hypothetical protein AAFX90_06175 [Pseudomonadota bacterium]|uniref:hypothetical protein n=1 Tax=Ruegeria sp. SCP10 TaxID=3141377 RepID=UPI0032298BED
MALNILWRFAEPYLQDLVKSKPQAKRLAPGVMRRCNGPLTDRIAVLLVTGQEKKALPKQSLSRKS